MLTVDVESPLTNSDNVGARKDPFTIHDAVEKKTWLLPSYAASRDIQRAKARRLEISR